MANCAIVGINWGDEGKGRMVDYLTGQYDVVVRYQGGGNAGRGGGSRKPLSEKDRLVQQYNKLQQDIDTYENNIGFFSTSKNSAPLIQKMQERIDAAKQELKDLEAKIRKAEESEEEK